MIKPRTQPNLTINLTTGGEKNKKKTPTPWTRLLIRESEVNERIWRTDWAQSVLAKAFARLQKYGCSLFCFWPAHFRE